MLQRVSFNSHQRRSIQRAKKNSAVVKEQQEAAEAEHAITEMDRRKQSKMEHKAHLLAQIEATQEAIRKKRESDSPLPIFEARY